MPTSCNTNKIYGFLDGYLDKTADLMSDVDRALRQSRETRGRANWALEQAMGMPVGPGNRVGYERMRNRYGTMDRPMAGVQPKLSRRPVSAEAKAEVERTPQQIAQMRRTGFPSVKQQMAMGRPKPRTQMPWGTPPRLSLKTPVNPLEDTIGRKTYAGYNTGKLALRPQTQSFKFRPQESESSGTEIANVPQRFSTLALGRKFLGE